MGDLLTYGTEPNEVVDLLLEFSKKINCKFIKGNHDQMYFDLKNGTDPFKYKMPRFVKESILWTNEILDFDIENTFDWIESVKIKSCYFAHANPFGYGNWTYLNNNINLQEAKNSLINKNVSVGIFGHTHRSFKKIINVKDGLSKNHEDNFF